MIIVNTRFRVINEMGDAVQNAFASRPQPVDSVPGFLGREVFHEAGDPAILHLVTRWTDRTSFDAWDGSENQRSSHSSIPQDLKLDPGFTRVEVLERLPDNTPSPEHLEHLIADSAPCWHVTSRRRARCTLSLPSPTEW
jgi:heme-degrading monooxygenase HmoA